MKKLIAALLILGALFGAYRLGNVSRVEVYDDYVVVVDGLGFGEAHGL